jgi:ketosteroid isomerase-like protein
MLRRTILTLLAAVASLAAQTGVAEEVKKAETDWINAVKANDLKALDGILATDLVYTHSTGLIESKQQYLNKLKTGDQKYASIEHSGMRVQTFGTTGIITGKVRMTGATKGVPFDNQLLMIHVWVKNAGRWQLVAHQTTRVQ